MIQQVMKRNGFTRRGGLTLVELLMAMTVTTILTLGLHQAFQQSYRVWSATEDRRPVYIQSNLFFDHMRSECSGLYLSPTTEDINQPTASTSSGRAASTGSGQATSRNSGQAELTVEDVVDVNTPGFKLIHQPGAARTTLLEYTTLTPAWGRHLMLSRPCRVRYEAIRDTQTGLLSIHRYEQFCAGNKLVSDEVEETVLQGLSDLKIWVANPGLSGLSWKRLYESNDFLPGAIKLLLTWPLKRQADVVTFEMIFDIVGLHATQETEDGDS